MTKITRGGSSDQVNKTIEQLRKSENKFRIVADFTVDWECWINQKDELVYISPSCENITGYSVNEFYSNPNLIIDISHPDDREFMLSHHDKIKNSEHIADIAFRIITKNGDIRWIERKCQPVYGINRENLGRRSSNRDITERQSIEKKLKEDEEKFRIIADFSIDWEYWINQKKELVYISPSCENISGYSADEFYTNPNLYIDITHPEDREIRFKHNKRIKNSEFVDVIEFRIITKYGDIRWVSHKCQPIYGVNQKYLGHRGSNRDITERKKISMELKESEKKFRRFVENSPNRILLTDLNGIIKYINHIPHYVTLKRVIGESIFQFIIYNQRENYKKVFEKSIKNKRVTQIESESIFGNTFIYQFIPFLHNDIIDEVFIIGIDITERKKLLEERSLAQRFESIGQLAGGIAHDYNNILVTILGNIELLQLGIELNSEQKEIFKELSLAIKRATELTSHLLIFSKGGLSRTKLQSLKEIINVVVPFTMSGSNSKCNIKYIDPIPWVDVNAGQLNRVFNNLLLNAIQSMPDGGIIDLSVKSVEITDHPTIKNGKYVEIVIQDHGCGIHPENHDKIFNPYFTTKSSGNGLGLTASYSIIKNHKGYITFTSVENVGTTFSVYLLAIDEILDQEKKKKKKKDPGIGKKFTQVARILIMDDDTQIHKTLNRILQKINIQVESAFDGQETLKKYKNAIADDNKFDLVIMDLTIPGGMGGKETIKHLRKVDPKAKVIVSSGYSDDPIMANYKLYGFDEVMAKPYSIDKLKEVISKFL